MITIFKGISGILSSRKATMALIVLIVSTLGMMTSHIDGQSFVALMTTVSGIFMYFHSKSEIKSMEQK